MPTNVNCQYFRASDSACLHAAAPRKWFGLAQCVLIWPSFDARHAGCALQYPHRRPEGYPLASVKPARAEPRKDMPEELEEICAGLPTRAAMFVRRAWAKRDA